MRNLMTMALLGFLVSGCVPLALSGATEGAVVVAQERSVGEAVDDAGIYLAIKKNYAVQPKENTLFADIMVKVIEGRVFLTGSVEKPETQVDAVNLAWQVNGVREVVNEIQVTDQSGFGDYAKDVWISTQIRTRLLITKDIRSVNYSIITVNQVVYLMGIAQDQAELERATWVASTTQYVKRVISHVRLKTDPRRPGPVNPDSAPPS